MEMHMKTSTTTTQESSYRAYTQPQAKERPTAGVAVTVSVRLAGCISMPKYTAKRNDTSISASSNETWYPIVSH